MWRKKISGHGLLTQTGLPGSFSEARRASGMLGSPNYPYDRAAVASWTIAGCG